MENGEAHRRSGLWCAFLLFTVLPANARTPHSRHDLLRIGFQCGHLTFSERTLRCLQSHDLAVVPHCAVRVWVAGDGHAVLVGYISVNDRPAALLLVIAKCFERLIVARVTRTIPSRGCHQHPPAHHPGWWKPTPTPRCSSTHPLIQSSAAPSSPNGTTSAWTPPSTAGHETSWPTAPSLRDYTSAYPHTLPSGRKFTTVQDKTEKQLFFSHRGQTAEWTIRCVHVCTHKFFSGFIVILDFYDTDIFIVRPGVPMQFYFNALQWKINPLPPKKFKTTHDPITTIKASNWTPI